MRSIAGFWRTFISRGSVRPGDGLGWDGGRAAEPVSEGVRDEAGPCAEEHRDEPGAAPRYVFRVVALHLACAVIVIGPIVIVRAPSPRHTRQHREYDDQHDEAEAEPTEGGSLKRSHALFPFDRAVVWAGRNSG